MENKDLGNKKMNNEQKVNEGFSGKNIPENYDPAGQKMQQEVETDKQGDTHTVDRARHTETNVQSERNWNENESLSRTVSNEEDVKRSVEHKDFNSDTTAKRYDKSHPDNKENRGNIELDE